MLNMLRTTQLRRPQFPLRPTFSRADQSALEADPITFYFLFRHAGKTEEQDAYKFRPNFQGSRRETYDHANSARLFVLEGRPSFLNEDFSRLAARNK